MKSEFPEHFVSWQAAESCWRSVNDAIEKSTLASVDIEGEISLSKDEAIDILSAIAISMVMWQQDSIADDFEEDGVGGTRGDIGREFWRDLTESEAEVARMILSGAPNKNIAVTLNISSRTVDCRRHAILKKLGASSALEFAEIAANTSKLKTIRTKYSGETTAIEGVNRTNIGRLQAIVSRRLKRVFDWDEIQARKYLDETIRRFSNISELGLLETEEDAFEWRHSMVRDFLAASWMVRRATQDDQRWFAERQYSVLDHSKGGSRFPQLKFVWMFICATPDNSPLSRDDGEGHSCRWNTLM